MCIRCQEDQALDGRPFCVRCTFAVRAQVEDGLGQLADYLAAWAAFDAWGSSRGHPASA